MARRRGPGARGGLIVAGPRALASLLAAILVIGTGAAAAQDEPSGVAFVDMQVIETQYLLPNLQGPRAQLEQRVIDLQAEFDERSAGLDDEEKQSLFNQYQNRLDLEAAQLYQFRDELVARIQRAIAGVASEQGFAIVLSKEAVLYGGTDLTGAVLRRLGVQTIPAGGG